MPAFYLDKPAQLLQCSESQLHIGVWTYNQQSHDFSLSPLVRELYGVTTDTVPSRDATMTRIHPRDRDKVSATLREAFAAGSSFSVEHRLQHPNGRDYWLQITGELLPENGGQWLGFIQDITDLVTSREALSRSLNLLNTAGHLAHFGGWRLDIAPRRLTWSPETAMIHEEQEDFQPSLESGLRYFAEGDQQRVREALQHCLQQGEPYELQVQLITARGNRRWVRTCGQAERDDNGVIVAVNGSLQDITEQVVATQRADTLAHQLETTLENISDAFFTLDTDWRFRFVNGRALEILGASREQLLGRNVWQAFPDALDSDFQQHYEHTLNTGETSRFAAWYGGELQKWFEIAAYRVPEGLAVYFRDVTTERQQEQALRIANERFRLFAQATNDVIWDWDFQAGTIWWSENLLQQFGHDPATLEPGPESWSGNIHPEDRQDTLTSVQAVIDGSGDRWSGEYRFLRADGSPRAVVDRGFVIRDAQGRALRMIGSMIDITERRELEERVLQAQKMEAVGQLTGGVAHDFNNLLTVLIGNAEILLEELPPHNPLRRHAELSLSTAERGAELTNRLLAFARRQALQPEVLQLDRQLAGMQALLRRTLNASIDIQQIYGEDLWHAEVDPGQLEVALLNLAINARDAMPAGGRLILETANTWLDEDYAAQHADVIPGPYVRVSVSDTGEGMHPEVAARAFEPFFTTKEVGRGSGLGLSMVFGFVKQSGGHIKIYSEPGEGTTVKLYFPRTARAGDSRTAPDVAPSPRGLEHILVVEDDKLVREHLVAQLQSLGYRVSSAGDGPAALRELEEIGDIDLLLTDVIMPGGINGPELAERVLRLRPGTRVLYTSGYTENAIVHHGRVDPGVALLGKPYRRQELASKVRSVLDGG